jgi:hypothetical protein
MNQVLLDAIGRTVVDEVNRQLGRAGRPTPPAALVGAYAIPKRHSDGQWLLVSLRLPVRTYDGPTMRVGLARTFVTDEFLAGASQAANVSAWAVASGVLHELELCEQALGFREGDYGRG